MIIPVRCLSCNKTMSAREEEYLRLRDEFRKTGPHKGEVMITSMTTNAMIRKMATLPSAGQPDERTPECRALDRLGFTRFCCRTVFLTYTDLPRTMHVPTHHRSPTPPPPPPPNSAAPAENSTQATTIDD